MTYVLKLFITYKLGSFSHRYTLCATSHLQRSGTIGNIINSISPDASTIVEQLTHKLLTAI